MFQQTFYSNFRRFYFGFRDIVKSEASPYRSTVLTDRGSASRQIAGKLYRSRLRVGDHRVGARSRSYATPCNSPSGRDQSGAGSPGRYFDSDGA